MHFSEQVTLSTLNASCQLKGFLLLSHVFLAKAWLTLPLVLVPGKLSRSTQSEARPEWSQVCNLAFVFVLPHCLDGPGQILWVLVLSWLLSVKEGWHCWLALWRASGVWIKAEQLEAFVTRSFETSALPGPSLQTLCWWPKALLQSMVGMGCVESRGLFLLAAIIVNVQNVVTFLNFFWNCAWVQDEKLVLSAGSWHMLLPSKPRWRGKRGGRKWEGGDGMGGSCSCLSSPNKKVRSRHLILHFVCFGVCTACVCVWGKEQMAAEWGWITKGKVWEVVSERILREKRRKLFI